MSSSEELITKLCKEESSFDYSALVPNDKGFISALKSGIKHIGVFTTVSEAFSKKNTNCTIGESMQRISNIIKLSKENNIRVYKNTLLL